MLESFVKFSFFFFFFFWSAVNQHRERLIITLTVFEKSLCVLTALAKRSRFQKPSCIHEQIWKRSFCSVVISWVKKKVFFMRKRRKRKKETDMCLKVIFGLFILASFWSSSNLKNRPLLTVNSMGNSKNSLIKYKQK